MSFGFASTSGIFQELMSAVLHGLGDWAIAYLDDTIIFSASEEHKEYIQKIFDCLKATQLKIKTFKM